MAQGFGVRDLSPEPEVSRPWEERHRRAALAAAEAAENAAYRARGEALGRALRVFAPIGRRRWFFCAVGLMIAQGVLLGVLDLTSGRVSLFDQHVAMQAYFEAFSGTLNPFEGPIPGSLMPVFMTYFWIQMAAQPLAALLFARRMRQSGTGLIPGFLIYALAAFVYFTLPIFTDHGAWAQLIPVGLLIWGALAPPYVQRMAPILR